MSLVIVCVLAGTAAAQAPGATEPPVAPAEPAHSQAPGAPSLEQQVSDQLAAQGIALAKRNLGLRIDPPAGPPAGPAAGPWTISLVEAGNGRVAASIQVDAPAEPEAALPVVTRAAAELAGRVDRRVNELKLKFMSMRFAPAYEAPNRPSHAPRQWHVFRGAADEELDTPEFFAMVGRDDLAASFRHRHTAMVGSYVVAIAGFATAVALAIESRSPLTDCSAVQGPQGQTCIDRNQRTNTPAVVALVAGLAGLAVGTYLYRHPQPIDETDAKALADGYNQRLRGALGLQAAARRPRPREVAVAPFVGRSDAGLALGARF